MAEVIIAEFEIDRLTAPALDLVKAAVKYAQKHKNAKLHVMSVEKLCGLANLPCLDFHQMRVLLRQSRTAIVKEEVVDTDLPEREDTDGGSWTVFNEVELRDSQVLFEICARIWDSALLDELWSLTVE